MCTFFVAHVGTSCSFPYCDPIDTVSLVDKAASHGYCRLDGHPCEDSINFSMKYFLLLKPAPCAGPCESERAARTGLETSGAAIARVEDGRLAGGSVDGKNVRTRFAMPQSCAGMW